MGRVETFSFEIHPIKDLEDMDEWERVQIVSAMFGQLDKHRKRATTIQMIAAYNTLLVDTEIVIDLVRHSRTLLKVQKKELLLRMHRTKEAAEITLRELQKQFDIRVN